MNFIRSRFVVAVMLGLAFLSACKKKDSNNTNTTTTTSASDALKDSALLYTKDVYLWYNQIPSSFNARSYSDIDKLMIGLRQYSTEPGFSGPVDKWSFAVKKAEWDNVSSGVSTGD